MATSNYSTIYQYDPLGQTSNLGTGSTDTYWAANIFTASASHMIAAAGFYVASNSSGYEVYCYKNVTAGAPRSGTLAASKTGTIAKAGFHTIDFDTPVALTAGTLFSIVVKFQTPGYYFPIPMEKPVAGLSSTATAAAGQSYYSSSGSSWTDLTTFSANTNACIKAYATPCTASVPTGISATGTCTGVTVSWSPVTGATSYNVLRGSVCGTTATTFTNVTSPYADTTAVAGTTYQYWVVAINECATSANSTCQPGTRLTPPAPTITGNSTGCATPGVSLGTQSFSGYQWYRGGILIGGATSQTYTATQSGSYTVTVAGSNGCSGTSPGKAVTVDTPPASPGNSVLITPSGTSALIDWSDCSGATSYNVRKNTNPASDPANFTTCATPSTSTYTDAASIPAGSVWWYAVEAVSGSCSIP